MSEKLKKLINAMAQGEAQLLNTEFFAPCVRGGKLRARVNNLIYTFKALPDDFEGWGIFLPLSDKQAELLEEANLYQIAEYMKLLKPLRVRLALQLRGQTWLAYPANEADAEQRFQQARPMLIHLVTEGAPFESIIACTDGSAFFFADADRRSDPLLAQTLRQALADNTQAADLRFEHLTPEMRTAYQLALQPYVPPTRHRRHHRAEVLPAPQTDAERLQQALEVGGGNLQSYTDRGDYWTVEWTSRSGERHASAISKAELTVISSGICLSGRDRDFDLQSLVGVIDGEW
ncbi:MAG: hypothetical protein HY231_07695 [Acidobacteria bacterium]|nr:hypothetical protein [Acidobacteriota bacterium]